MNSKKSEKGVYSAFVAENANYFAQAFSPLNEVFGNDGNMKIVSEEIEYTVVVVMRKTTGNEDPDKMVIDVDCAILEAKQESIRDCLVSLDEGVG